MIMLQMNLEMSSKMYQMNFKLQALGFIESWHWPCPLAQECCLSSKSICPRSSQQSTQKFFRVFVIIMYINGQRPHKQAKYTQTKYITQYGPSGQSENGININNQSGMNNGK